MFDNSKKINLSWVACGSTFSSVSEIWGIKLHTKHYILFIITTIYYNNNRRIICQIIFDQYNIYYIVIESSLANNIEVWKCCGNWLLLCCSNT